MRIKPKRTFVTRNTSSSLLKSFVFLACFLLVSVTNIYAQTKTITGTVTDEFNEALIGVSVRVQGTTTGTLTDVDGAYSISANTGDMLEFTYVGMKTQLIKVGATNTINVSLKDDAQLLKETVVIGYGSAKKRDLTGSIVTVKAADIANKPAANPLASIQGKIAGVQVVNSGRPGQDPEINIRGVNSFNGNRPLYVVDGLFSDNINYLNPTDIETMEVLKDPSSLAIFGVRGANGVIIINTKRAKEGQTIVNINSAIGFRKVSHKMPLTNAAQFRELYDEQLANAEQAPFDYTNWQANTDWQDEAFQSGFLTNNNVSITGASEKNKFYLGIGYASEEGVVKYEKFSRLTVNLNSDYNVTKNLRFGFQINGARTLPPDAKNVEGVVRAAPIAPVYFDYADPKTGAIDRLFHTMPDFQRAQVGNPMIDIIGRARHNIGVNHRVAGNIYGEVDFLQHFNFRTMYSYDFAIGEERGFRPIIYTYNPSTKTRETADDRIEVTQAKQTQLAAQQDYILTYTNKFGDHALTATAGLTTNYNEFSRLQAARRTLADDIVFPISSNNTDQWWLTSMDRSSMSNQGTSEQRNPNELQWKAFTMSYLLRGLYNYKGRYLFNASYRRDGASVFYGTGNAWDNFGSLGGAWIASDEAFMADQNVVDYLKVKASWGVLGSQSVGSFRYPTYPPLVSSGGAVFGDNVITSWSSQYLPGNLRWEKTKSWDAGVEVSLLDQRLRVEPTYYSKVTEGIIVSLPSRNGAFNTLENFGDVRNRGLELLVSWADKIGSTGIKYTVSANLTTIDNEVTKLGYNDAIFDGPARTIKGQPMGSFFGYVVEGVYQNLTDIRKSPEYTLGSIEPGDLKFKDLDGDNRITPADRTMIGSPIPSTIYGFNGSISYKGFDLGIEFMGVYGNEIYRNWDHSEYAVVNYLTKRMDRWNGEGTSNWEPRLAIAANPFQQNSNYFVEDGSFFRIRNVQLGYTFNDSFLRKLFVKSLRVYGNIENLKTWAKNTGYTPELGGSPLRSAVDNGTYPIPSVYTFGLNVTF